MRHCLRLTTLAVLSLTAPAPAAIIVDASGGGDYLTIQEGINAASEGDSVIVSPGTYTGTGNRNLQFGGTDITLTSLGNTATTIIDCEGQDRAFFLLNTGEDTTCVIQALTIRNGHAATNGGGIFASGAALTIEGCVIEDCSAGSNAGGVYLGYDAALGGSTIKDCVLRGNHAGFRAGGVLVDNGIARIIGCTFDHNSTAGEGDESFGGGAVCCNSVDGMTVIASSTFVGNSSVQNASGIHGYTADDVYVRTSVFAFGEGGPAITAWASDYPMIDYNVFYANPGGDYPGVHPDNLTADPLFCGVLAGDFTLCANSPCLPGVNGWGQLVGAHDAGCGECESPVNDASWGRIKALWR